MKNAYLLISDLHLGNTTSLFYADDGLSDIGKSILENVYRTACNTIAPDCQIQLILLGDCVDFGFATIEEVVKHFNALFSYLALIDRTHCRLTNDIIYLPGNHDHRLWKLEKDQVYFNSVSRGGTSRCHSTGLVNQQIITSAFLRRCAELAPHNPFTFQLHYPNYALVSPHKNLILHHGHYLEKTYKLVSIISEAILNEPCHSAEKLEAQNGAWIDFAWSGFGLEGDKKNFRHQLHALYESEFSWSRLTHQLSEKLKHLPLSDNTLIRTLESNLGINTTELSYAAVRSLVAFLKSELVHDEASFNHSFKTEARWYIEKILVPQLKEESIAYDNKQNALLIGHFHQGFDLEVDGLCGGMNWNIHCLGGWTIENFSESDCPSGSVVLLNENLDAVKLTYFENSQGCSKATCLDPSPNSFYERLKTYIERNSHEFSALQQAITEDIQRRIDRLVQSALEQFQ